MHLVVFLSGSGATGVIMYDVMGGYPGDSTHSVAVVFFPGLAPVDIAGPMEAFALANHLSGKEFYLQMTASEDGAPVTAAGGYMDFSPTHSFETLPKPLGTLLIPGRSSPDAVWEDKALLGWLRDVEPQCDRVASVCNGAYTLCASGLAEGHTVATHWANADDLACRYPDTRIEADSLFVTSGKIWSSAGMTAGIDLALAMIESDLGHAVAMDVARYMVVHLRRAGGQSQFSMHLKAQFSGTPVIQRIQHLILDHPDSKLSIERLAELAAMSPRNFLRLFKAETGIAVGAFISDVRLRHACRLLEGTGKSLGEIAGLSGLGSDANMRKVFKKNLGVTPIGYRRAF